MTTGATFETSTPTRSSYQTGALVDPDKGRNTNRGYPTTHNIWHTYATYRPIFTPLWHLNAPGLVLYVEALLRGPQVLPCLVDPDKGKWTLLEHMHSMLRPFMGVASFLRAGGV